MEEVSIIIPVYNVQNYLPQCLDSLVAQSYPNWTAFLVDDGSTDSSGQICDAYAGADSRFRVIHKENGGAASAKNAGLDHAVGAFVAFVDSDDYVEPTWLSTLIHTAQDSGADVVEFDFDKVYKTHTEAGSPSREAPKVFTEDAYLAQYLTDWTNSLFWNKLFRRELLNGIRFRRERRCIDDEFFTYKVLSGAKRVMRIPDVLYHYRQRASSAVYSEKNQLQITEDALEVLIERYEWICSRFPGLQRLYLQHDIDILFYFAGFRHNKQTIKKFRRISRYYFGQALRTCSGFSTMYRVCRLQMLSTSSLLNFEKEYAVEHDLSQYFE